MLRIRRKESIDELAEKAYILFDSSALNHYFMESSKVGNELLFYPIEKNIELPLYITNLVAGEIQRGLPTRKIIKKYSFDSEQLVTLRQKFFLRRQCLQLVRLFTEHERVLDYRDEPSYDSIYDVYYNISKSLGRADLDLLTCATILARQNETEIVSNDMGICSTLNRFQGKPSNLHFWVRLDGDIFGKIR